MNVIVMQVVAKLERRMWLNNLVIVHLNSTVLEVEMVTLLKGEEETRVLTFFSRKL